jgi:uncharacterized LabA/DUF88 family protein
LPSEPPNKRAVAFFDGQNLFHAARETFGYSYPNYDPKALAQAVSNAQGWQLVATRFYTGVPDSEDNAFWNHFWTAKLAQLGREGVWTFSRPLRYQKQIVKLPDGREQITRVGHEKGIDVRIALDVVRLALEETFDVAIIFSQDQDLSELSDEIRAISRRAGRWLKLASAFPVSSNSRRRGIDRTDWLRIDRQLFDRCLDPRDYRPKP